MNKQVEAIWMVECLGNGTWVPLQWYHAKEDADAGIFSWEKYSTAPMRVTCWMRRGL